MPSTGTGRRTVDQTILKYAMERARRERLALSATWASPDKTSAATIKARRLRDWSQQGGKIPALMPTLGIGNAANSLGSLRRTARDNVPPREVLTEIIYPNPEPGRPFPGAEADEIKAWNILVLSRDPR